MKWFSIDGIAKETKRIRWPHTKDLMFNTAEVIFFVVLFAIFFMVCEIGIAFFLKLIGIGA